MFKSLAALKAKLEGAKEAKLQSHSEQSSRLQSYSSRFRRPNESRDSSTNSRHSFSESRATTRDSSASWRKKDSRFIRPNDSEAHDERVCSNEVRKREPTDDAVSQQVSKTSETVHSQIPARKARKSRNYK